jgi:hypothetical protein
MCGERDRGMFRGLIGKSLLLRDVTQDTMRVAGARPCDETAREPIGVLDVTEIEMSLCSPAQLPLVSSLVERGKTDL